MAGFGGSVKLTGESEYKKALSNIKTSLREVSSEMKLVSAQFQSSDKNTTALASKSADLSKKLQEQKQAITSLKDSYNQMAQQYDAQKKKTADLQSAYDAEKAKLEQIKATLGTSSSAYQQQAQVVDKLEQELKESTQAEESMGKSLSNMRTQINNAEASVVKAENSLNSMNEELEETDDDAGKASDALDDTGDSADKAGGKFEKLGKVAGAAMKALGAAMLAAAAGAVAIGKASIENYADYEQLVGGVETLFGTGGKSLKEYADSVGLSVEEAKGKYKDLEQAQSDVMKNAAQAYKTAGMSANDYMETVTSFSASLISSLDGDTVAAAKAADMAITDMSDNANKMGTDIESIQNAYQGFAKQNYTMLDNLKLGYGGTKEEMQRLLDDAEKLSGVKYDMSNLNDVYEAIHVVQTEMGITGTTADEAAKTISGSMGMAKAAWSNLLTGMADDNADFSTLISNFVDSIVTVSKNLLPRIKVVIGGLGDLVGAFVKDVLPGVLKEIPNIVGDLLPVLITAISSLIKGITTALPSLIATVVSLIPMITAEIEKLTPLLLQSGIDVIVALLNGLNSALPSIIDTILNLIPVIITTLLDATPKILEAGLQLFMGLVMAIPKIITKLVPQIPKIINSITNTLLKSIDMLMTATIQLFDGMMQALPVVTEMLVKEIPNIIQALISMLIKLTPVLFRAFITMFAVATTAMIKTGADLVKKIPALITNIADAFKPLTDVFKKAWEKVKEVFSGVKGWFSDKFKEAVTGIKNAFSGIGEFFGGVWDTIKSKFSALGTSIASAISGSVKSGINGVITMIQNTINSGISMINSALGAINKIPGVNVGKISDVKLPRLAKGGIVDKATLAEIGENGREAIIPLENNKGWIKELAAELQSIMLSPLNNFTKEATAADIANNTYTETVAAFKDALGQMKIVLDDEQLGTFVEKTVADAIFI